MSGNYFEQHEQFLHRQQLDEVNKNQRNEELLRIACLDATGTEPERVMSNTDAKLLSDYVEYHGPAFGKRLELSEYSGKTFFTKTSKYESIWWGRGQMIGKIILPSYNPEVAQLRDSSLYICMDGLLRCSRNSKVFPSLSTAYDFSQVTPQVGALPKKEFLFNYHNAKNFRIKTGYNDMEWDSSSSRSSGGGSVNTFVEAKLHDVLLRNSPW